jgi:hypothetical protein
VKGSVVSPRPVYYKLSSQMARLQVSSTAMSAYTQVQPTHTPCSSTYTSVKVYSGGGTGLKEINIPVATSLPPKPNPTLCSCMMSTLRCVDNGEAAAIVDIRDYGTNRTKVIKVFNQFCSQNEALCLGITSNGTTGQYGAFSACNETERASWILDRAYKAQNNDSQACGSAGGVLQVPEANLPNQCQFLLRQARPDGTGIVLQDEYHETSNNKPKLSTGAKAGIAVGILVLILCALGICVLLRRRRKSPLEENAETLGTFEKAELPDSSIPISQKPMNEIDGTERQELAGVESKELDGVERKEIGGNEVIEMEDKKAVELPTIHNEPVELDSTWSEIQRVDTDKPK